MTSGIEMATAEDEVEVEGVSDVTDDVEATPTPPGVTAELEKKLLLLLSLTGLSMSQ